MHPNTGLHIYNNNFRDNFETAIFLNEGNAKAKIDSNKIIITHFLDTRAASKAIVVKGSVDTTYIVNNYFIFGTLATDSAIAGIEWEQPGTTSTSFAFIANNAFMRFGLYLLNGIEVIPNPGDSASQITGIDLLGSGVMKAGIYNNTMRFAGALDTNFRAPIKACLLRYRGTNAGNNVQVLNNLLVNTRVGGVAGSEILAMNLADTLGITTDYNTYNCVQGIKVGNVQYPSFNAYRLAHSSRDVHSNDSVVVFEGINTELLASVMHEKPFLQGQLLPTVARDMYNNARLYPYRGSYELTSACSGGPLPGSIVSLPTEACPGKNILLTYRPAANSSSALHQWQYMNGTTQTFTDIAGANSRELFTTQTIATTYRMKDSCLDGNTATIYSVPVTVGMVPPVDRGLLSEQHTGRTYDFTLTGATSGNHVWIFGDGWSNTGGITQTHYYPTDGVYTVQVTSATACGQDTATMVISVQSQGISVVGAAAGIVVYPNPANGSMNYHADDNTISLTIINNLGSIMLERQEVGKDARIDISNLAPGCYYLKATTLHGTSCVPLSIVR